jgi:hypothetical protein
LIYAQPWEPEIDSSSLIALLTDAALCYACIMNKTGASYVAVVYSLQTIRQTVVVTTRAARCDWCLEETIVLRVGK